MFIEDCLVGVQRVEPRSQRHKVINCTVAILGSQEGIRFRTYVRKTPDRPID